MENRAPVTFGQQLLENQAKMADDTPMLARDLHHDMLADLAGKLKTFVMDEAQKNPSKSFYVLVYMGKDLTLETVVRAVIQARWTKPRPEPSSFLYYFDHKKETFDLLYSLPPEYSMANILMQPHLYDPLLVDWVRKYKKNEL